MNMAILNIFRYINSMLLELNADPIDLRCTHIYCSNIELFTSAEKLMSILYISSYSNLLWIMIEYILGITLINVI